MQPRNTCAGDRLLPTIKRRALVALALLLTVLKTTLGAQRFNLPGREQRRRGLQLRFFAGLQRDGDALGKTDKRHTQDQNGAQDFHQRESGVAASEFHWRGSSTICTRAVTELIR